MKEEITLKDLLLILAQEIAFLKEDRCQNEGANWFDKFENTLNYVMSNKTICD